MPDNEGRQGRSDNQGQFRNSPTGLGLFTNAGQIGNATSRRQSTSTAPDDAFGGMVHPFTASQIPSTKTNSLAEDSAQRASPTRNLMDLNRSVPPLNVHGTAPYSLNPEDLIQSATEIATPSNSNTPNLSAVDQAVQETKNFVDALSLFSATAERNAVGSDGCPNNSNNIPGRDPQPLPTNSLATLQDPLQQALRSASPQLLQQIIPYLARLHNLLNSIPKVAETIQEIIERISNLENQSFSHIAPDEINHQFELFDARLLDLEGKMEEQKDLQATIDADQSNRENAFLGRRGFTATESFASNYSSRSVNSAQSVASPALILAAIDRKEIGTEIEDIKGRLDTLEAAALPTFSDPWQVEVVLLPWGRELRGIWYSPDESMHDPTKATTQDTEEWTQARSLRSASGSSLRLHEAGNGWNSQAINEWADTTDEWLWPKACGTNNIIYKRLQSRGFVRNVTIKSQNSGDIQAAIASAFSDLLEHLQHSDDVHASHHADAADRAISSFPALNASFIPLRKILKSSRLRFLNLAEMSTSALWTAQFLAAGIIMRVSGGQKRLYVTQRDAYLQTTSHAAPTWTWPRLRELPRTRTATPQPHSNSHVTEADARESCWSYYPGYDDAPVAASLSFTSSTHSGQLSLRPAEHYQWPKEATPAPCSCSPQKSQNHHQNHPISPLSEFPPRPRTNFSHHRRTVSIPLTDDPFVQYSGKRRAGTSASVADTKTVNVNLTSSAPAPASKQKRRRLTHSPSPLGNLACRHMEEKDTQPIWAPTPRRSKEPPSPFFGSHPELLREDSNVSNTKDGGRSSQRSSAQNVRRVGPGGFEGVYGESKGGGGGGGNGKGGNTPFAYATPHSGTGAGIGAGFGGGDTEADSGSEKGDDDGGSWHGVGGDEDGEDDVGSVGGFEGSEDELVASSSAIAMAMAGAEEVEGSEEEEEDEDSDSGFGFGFGDEDEGEDMDVEGEGEESEDDD